MNLINQTGFLTVVQSALSLRLCTLNQYSLGKQQILFSCQFVFPRVSVLSLGLCKLNKYIPPVKSKFCFLVSFFFPRVSVFPTMELRETMRLFPVKPNIKCFVTHAGDKQSKQAKTRGFITVYNRAMQLYLW